MNVPTMAQINSFNFKHATLRHTAQPSSLMVPTPAAPYLAVISSTISSFLPIPGQTVWAYSLSYTTAMLMCTNLLSILSKACHNVIVLTQLGAMSAQLVVVYGSTNGDTASNNRASTQPYYPL
jgi:hypothetical protein